VQAGEQQRAWGRIGGLRAHGRHGSDEMLSAARAGFAERWLREADPDGQLEPAERQRRADRLRKAHMLMLAQRSAAVRRKTTPQPILCRCRAWRNGRISDHADHLAEYRRSVAGGQVPDETAGAA